MLCTPKCQTCFRESLCSTFQIKINIMGKMKQNNTTHHTKTKHKPPTEKHHHKNKTTNVGIARDCEYNNELWHPIRQGISKLFKDLLKYKLDQSCLSTVFEEKYFQFVFSFLFLIFLSVSDFPLLLSALVINRFLDTINLEVESSGHMYCNGARH